MQTAIVTYIKQISRLSNKQLVAGTKSLNSDERRAKVKLIAHLAEISERRLHLELGYKSLFDYCTRGLNISEGSVWHRIQVANICRRFPAVLTGLADGRLSLTVAGKISPHLTKENHADLIKNCRGLSKREVEVIIAGLKPQKPVSSGIRKAGSQTELHDQAAIDATGTGKAGGSAAGSNGSAGNGTVSGNAAAAGVPQDAEPPKSPNRSRGDVTPADSETYNIRFAASREVTAKLKRLGEILGVKQLEKNLEKVIDQALEDALDNRDPQRRLQRRQKREEKKREKKEKSSPEKVADGSDDTREKPTPAKVGMKPKRSRYIPRPVRDKVLARAGYQCEYNGPEGVRCTQRHGLHVDHVVSFARGGSNEPENLQALCAAHNIDKGRREFGRAGPPAQPFGDTLQGVPIWDG